MADQRHVAILKDGVDRWNIWRQSHRHVVPDLRSAHLSLISLGGAQLRAARLGGARLNGAYLWQADFVEADLNRADLQEANLWGAYMASANLTWANLTKGDLRTADLTGADLSGANLREARLERAIFSKTKLCSADLREAHCAQAKFLRANLSGANLSGLDLTLVTLTSCDLSGANLTGVELKDRDLTGINLQNANLSGVDFRGANMRGVRLDGAMLTDAKLWETQRAGWSVTGATCERAYWDKQGIRPTLYRLGEFENHHADSQIIEIVYKGGITRFELNTLPALMHHLESLQAGCHLRLRSIEDAPGGTKVVIVVDDPGEGDIEALERQAGQLQAAQLELRDVTKVRERLEIENAVLLDKIIPRMLEAAGKKEFHISTSAAVGNIVVDSPSATSSTQQTVGDLAEIRSLVDAITSGRAELQLPNTLLTNLDTAVHSLRTELAGVHPNTSVVREGLKTVRSVLEGAVGSTIATAWWPTVSELIRRLS